MAWKIVGPESPAGMEPGELLASALGGYHESIRAYFPFKPVESRTGRSTRPDSMFAKFSMVCARNWIRLRPLATARPDPPGTMGNPSLSTFAPGGGAGAGALTSTI